MNCLACGAEAVVGQRFCGGCGSSLIGECPSCGVEYGPGQRFCVHCGTSLAVNTETAPSPDRVVAAERRIVSVLFVDLVGFTSLSEGRDPEDVRALVTRYFDVAREIVERFGGTVDKYIGDAVMAWWGATASQEDDAERAVRAALEVVDRVESLGEEIGIEALAARAGVMTGEASVGPGGNEKGLLLGDLVNSTSRIQSVAEPGTVLVGPTTAGLVGGAIDLIDAGSHVVKGREEPIVASRALRTVAERGGRGRVDALEPPFVGRVSELRLLKEMLHAAGNDGRARLVSLVGQAGIGKSRLIWEFRKYVDGLVETVYWHEGRSPSYGDGITLWALAEMIRHRAGILESDDDETTLRQLRKAVADHVREPSEQEWIGDRLASLLGVGDAVSQEREDLFAAARAFLERLSREGTVVLVFEDLQWADPSLLEFIEELPDWSQNHPILVVTMTRPDLLERRPDWGSGRRGFTSLYVGPLTDDEMSELIEGTIPGIPSTLTAAIVREAGGVPLFAVEMIRMLISDGRLGAGSDGVTADDIAELEIPTSVQAVISARLDRLPPEDRELARDAAVLGSTFTSEGLAVLSDENTDKLERRLANLVRREILELVRDPLSPERGQYRWVQSLLREVAYGRIGRADRQALHLRAARYFRDLDDPELAPVAAAHFVAAGDGAPDAALQEEMVGTLRRAIERAQAVHGHEQVIGLVETALDVFPPDARIELHETAVRAAVRIQDNATADRHLEAVGAIAAADATHEHRAMALRGWVANESRRSESVRQALEDHLASHPDLGDDPDLARVAVYLARARLIGGDPLGAAELAHDALGTVEQLGLIEETADALVTMGTGLVDTRVNQGMALLRGALELCRRHGLGDTTLRALINIGYGTPDVGEALEATQQALEGARRVGDKSHALFALQNLVDGYMLDLQLDAVSEHLADPVAANPPAVDAVNLACVESRLLLFRGDRPGADSMLAMVRERAEEVDDLQVNLAVVNTEFTFNLMDLDLAACLATAQELLEDGFHGWVPATLLMGTAALAGKEEWLATAAATARELPPAPPADRIAKWGEAMGAILVGDDDGVSMVRQVADEFRRTLLATFSLTALAAAARWLPTDHPDRDLLADEARAIALAAGAVGLADWVDRVTHHPT